MIPFLQQALTSVDLAWNPGASSQNPEQLIAYLALAGLVTGITVLALRNHQLHRKIKQSRQVESRLRTSKSHYRALIQALPDLLMRVDENGIYLEFLASPNFRVLGNMPPEWVGTHVTENLPSKLAKQRLDAIAIALGTQSVQVYEQTICLDSNTFQMEQVRVVPYSPTEVLILVQDISDCKHAEKSLKNSEQRFRRAISMAPLPIMLYAEDGEVLYINDTWTQLSGYNASDLPTIQRWAELAYGDRAQDMIENLVAKKNISQPYQDKGDFEITTRQGNQRIWEFRIAPLEKLSDGRQMLIFMAVDVTQHRQAVKDLRNSEERYRSVYTQAAVGLASGNFDGQLLDVNPHFCKMLGYGRTELISKSIQEITHPDDWSSSKTLMESLVNTEITHALLEKRYIKQDGSVLWCNTGVSVVKDAAGKPQYALAVVRDISDRIKAETQLKHDAFHDALTGLPNRSLLMQRLELALKRTKRYPKTYLAILFIDLDNFKVINDSLGHLVGDELLLAISNQLKVIIRETDVAARLGGDEFIVLLEDINALSEATMVADRILEMLQAPFTIANRELFPSASIGIVTSDSNPNRQAADLLRDADVAMYWAKSNGRKQYAVFDPAMHLQAVHRLKIENYLRKAIENEEFQLYYQPIVNLKTLVIEGFETLLRWQHPERGLLLPHQ
ncbi:MAG: diguanylate cyclase, partial [Cyanobacteria bacterium J06642_11]